MLGNHWIFRLLCEIRTFWLKLSEFFGISVKTPCFQRFCFWNLWISVKIQFFEIFSFGNLWKLCVFTDMPEILMNPMHWPLPGTAVPARDLAMLNGWKALDVLASL